MLILGPWWKHASSSPHGTPTCKIHTSLAFIGANGNLKYIKLKINWADTPQCASKPFSAQVLAWLGLPETISKVGNTEQMAQKPAKEQWGLPRMRGASSSLWGSTESSASPMSPTHPEVHNGIILRRLVPLPPRHLPWLHDPWHRGLEAAGIRWLLSNMTEHVPKSPNCI